jgi:hypothetical protein
MQVPVGFQERFLHYIFRVFPVLRDVLRNPEDVAIIAANQFFKRRVVAPFGCLYERQLFANWSDYFVLDGSHSLIDAVFSDYPRSCDPLQT